MGLEKKRKKLLNKIYNIPAKQTIGGVSHYAATPHFFNNSNSITDNNSYL